MKFGKEIKLQAIADGAGTSMPTVSRYFNRIKISSSARNKIEKYLIDNNLAELIVESYAEPSKKKKLIGILVPDLTSYTFSDICMSALKEAERHGYEVITLCSQEKQEYERQALKCLKALHVDGIIYAPISYYRQSVYPELKDLGRCPIVIVNRRNVMPGRVHVYEDNITAGYDATKYMLGLGRTRIAFMLGSWTFPFNVEEMCRALDDNEEMGGYVSIDRLIGYKMALAESDIPFDPCLIAMSTWSNQSAISSAAMLISQSGSGFDGFIGCSDMLAASMINVLQQHGLNVPNDISVMGWGDSAISTLVRPQLTSVVPNTKRMGREAFLALNRILDGELVQDLKIQATITPRNSTYKKEN